MKTKDSSGPDLGRRNVLKAVGGAAALSGAISWSESEAATRGHWDHEVDVVVVGTGAAGLTAAVTATAEGASVLVLEAGPTIGGTTIRSGGGCWMPNNPRMREMGLTDNKADALRYMARYSYPDLYDPKDAHLGLPEASWRLLDAYYDNAGPAIERLESLDALHMRGEVAYDYWMDAPENKAPVGRTIFPTTPGSAQGKGATHPATSSSPEWRELNQQLKGGSSGSGGPLMIAQLSAWIAKSKTRVLLSHRVRRIVTNGKGEVIGVEATNADGKVVTVRARKAVHFGSGGFIFNPDLRRSYLRGPAWGGCAVQTSQGDLVYMATGIGAKLGNMQNGWNIGLILDEAIETPANIHSIWHIGGDSMFLVDKSGKRIVNEKLNYSDRFEIFNQFDSGKREWRNLVLFVIFDQRVKDLCAGLYPFAPAGEAAPYILKGDTLEELTGAISERLVKYGDHLGGFSLEKDFASNLKQTKARFDRFAETGVDEEFGRGSVAYDLQWHMRALGAKMVASNDKPNKTMYPLTGTGPYYAVPIVHGCADTSGGPVINEKGQVLSSADKPIAGLYGAGNCIASPSSRAYWGGGTTLGLAVTYGYIAARNAVREPVKQVG